jgi:hypothetical protein
MWWNGLNYKMKNKNLLMVVLGSFVLILIILLVAAADYYNLPEGLSLEITEHSTCRLVDNYAGGYIFIPTKTSAEWYSFIVNTPHHVSASQPCSGECGSPSTCIFLYPDCGNTMDCYYNGCCDETGPMDPACPALCPY